MTPIRINLLPHRQLRKARQQRWFAVLAAIVASLGLAAVGGGQVYIANAKSGQDARNTFLKEEIAKLDKQIAEIAQLKEKTQDLLSRKDVVEALQNNRGEAVHMFDELMRRLPDGLYLKSVKQTGDALAISGYAQSSARVSTFMRALEATELFDEPVLVEVKSAMVGPVRSYEFSLNVKIARKAPDPDKTEPDSACKGRLIMNLSELNNLDLKDITSAPAPVRALVLALLFVAIVAAGWYLVWSDALRSLDSARAEEQSLRDSFSAKKAQVFNYEAHKRRLVEVEQSLAAMLRQLPDRSQMDALLADINQVGVGRGLEFDLFRPGNETPADFYATLPVSIKVSGTYHDIGGFVSDLAKMPRIVTLHDVALVPGKDSALSMEARVQTYRYLDENELAAAKKQKQGGVKK